MGFKMFTVEHSRGEVVVKMFTVEHFGGIRAPKGAS
jgi:hypothetical protein